MTTIPEPSATPGVSETNVPPATTLILTVCPAVPPVAPMEMAMLGTEEA